MDYNIKIQQCTEEGIIVGTFISIFVASKVTEISKYRIAKCISDGTACYSPKDQCYYRFIKEGEKPKNKKIRREDFIAQYEYPSFKKITVFRNINEAFGDAFIHNNEVTYEQIYKSVKTKGKYVCKNGCVYAYLNEKPNPTEVKGFYDKKTICQFTNEGVFVAEFKNMKQASELTGAPYSSIYACIDKRQNSAGGFVWKRKSELLDELL